jgi:hypothetical protein
MARRRDGSALIGILIVVVIIIVVVMIGPFGSEKNPASKVEREVSMAQSSIDRSADATCALNRRTFENELVQARILNGGQLPSVEELRRRFSNKHCPRGGAILVGQDGKIYCTRHFPPPVQELQSMITLFEPVVETPVPPPPEATPLH